MQYPGLGHRRRHVRAAWQDVLLQAVTRGSDEQLRSSFGDVS